MINGWINLDKPIGMSSAGAVAKVKWLLKNAVRCEASAQYLMTPSQDPVLRLCRPQDLKIGHAGTLDPLATGILPLALGKATKKVSLMIDAGKSYEFTVTWGQERATDDAEGEITQLSENRPTLAEIQAILPQFIGEISQTPPNYSAIKLGGKRAYALARAGEVVEIKSRIVRVDGLLVASLRANKMSVAIQNNTDWIASASPRNDTTSFLCHCGKGTYIRSLARDMGRILGCYGYISELRRIKVGKFDESSTISLEMLENMVHKGCLDFLQPVDFVLDDILA